MNGDGRFEPIAIIGMAALMPDAPNVETFWSNVLEEGLDQGDGCRPMGSL